MGLLTKIAGAELVVTDYKVAKRFLFEQIVGPQALDLSHVVIEPSNVKIHSVEPSVKNSWISSLRSILVTLDMGDADFFLNKVEITTGTKDNHVRINGWHNYRPIHITESTKLQSAQCETWGSPQKIGRRHVCVLDIGANARTLVISVGSFGNVGEIESIKLEQ